jgi:hypothetical protein
MSVSTSVVRARWCDTDRIVDLVTDALSPTALGAWLVPDERRRPTVLAAAARIWVEHALLFGDAFLRPDRTAVAIWFHRYRPIPPPARYVERLGHACGVYQERFLRLGRTLGPRRPAEPHNHLAMLAAPGPDGAGRATALLAAAQRWMDTLNLPTYAEVLTERDRDLYRRHGFTDRDAFPVPGDTIVRGMWRLSPFRIGRSGGNGRWPARPAGARGRNDRPASIR